MMKRFRQIPHVGIYDELTGRILTTLQECCIMLNKESERADRNAELYYDELYGTSNEKP